MADKDSKTEIGGVPVKGATDADKQAIAVAKAAVKAENVKDANAPKTKAARKARTTRQVTKRGDQAPESGKTRSERSAKADKLFKDADEAARVGLPPDMTREQHENHVRRAALGY